MLTTFDDSQHTARTLSKIFVRINMSELPAMSSHVRELIAFTNCTRSSAADLSEIILKDYSLTNKVLQMVNSAFYGLSTPVSSISRAVTILGFDTIREMATAIAIFEDFIKSGVEKDAISKLLTRSFLSAMIARELSKSKGLKVSSEEAFICGLLHNLGKTIICIYLPDLYREIGSMVRDGIPEEEAAIEILDGLTFPQIGKEIARFWNLADRIVLCMETDPPRPANLLDVDTYLQNLTSFANQLVDRACTMADPSGLFERYGPLFELSPQEAVCLLSHQVENSAHISETLRYGLYMLKIRSKLRIWSLPQANRTDGPPPLAATPAVAGPPPQPGKTVGDCLNALAAHLKGRCNLNEFFQVLLDGLHYALGLDRVVFAGLSSRAGRWWLEGRWGTGEITAEEVALFTHELASSRQVFARSLRDGKDMAVPPDKSASFPAALRPLTRNRRVYLFPVRIADRPVALLYCDRTAERPGLTDREVKAVRMFRDLAVKAIERAGPGPDNS